MMLRMASVCFGLIILLSLAGGPARAAEPFYEGKTLKVVVVHPPGGGYDTYARLFARHLGKHIPGKPKVIVINMPGGSGLVGTNYVYNVTKPDGLTIVQPSWGAAQAQYLGFPGVKYDVNKFQWLGLVNASPITVVVGRGSPIKTIDQWLNPKTRILIFGCTSVNSLTCAIPLAMNELFGPTSKIVPGYQGTAAVRAALAKQEVDALTGWSWDSVKATGMSMINSGDARIIAYLGAERNSELDELKVPFLNDRIKKPEDVAFMRVLLLPAAMLRPWAAPPNTPKERVAILRKAFQETLKDPAFLADAKRVRLDINPRSGKYLTDLMIGMKAQMTPEVLTRARKIVGLEK